MLDFVAGFLAAEGYPPTYREIAAGCGFASPNTAYYHVGRLVEEGKLRLDKRRKIGLGK